jgi:hypothetical protein
VGALATVMSAVLPLVVGSCAVFSAALATTAVTGGSPHPNAAVPLAVGALLVVLTAWWGPGGSGLRRGSRSIVRGVVPGATATRVAVVIGLVLAAGLVVWGLQHGGQPQWWPWQEPGSMLPSALGLG